MYFPSRRSYNDLKNVSWRVQIVNVPYYVHDRNGSTQKEML
jgi:hypothetical protein